MRKLTLALALATVSGFGRPAGAAPTPRQLVEISDLADVAVAPDGTVAAFRRETASVERNTYDTTWYVVALDGANPPLRIADGGAPLRYNWGMPVIEPPLWSPDSRWIYYRAEFDGQVQVWRAARDGARAEPVTRDAADVEAFSLSRDGRSLDYTVGAAREDIARAERDEDDHGIRIDRSIFVGQNLTRALDYNGRLSTQRLTDDNRVEAGLLSDQPKRQKRVDLATLTVRDVSDAERARDSSPGAVQSVKADPTAVSISRSPTGDWTAFLTPVADPLNDKKRKLLKAVQEGDGKTVITCAAAVCQDADIAALAWRPGRGEVIFTVTDHARGRAQSLYGWNIGANTVRKIVSAEGLLNGGRVDSGETPCAVGERFAVCVGAANDVPPRLERLDLETGARQVLYDPNPTLHGVGAPMVSLLTWSDDQGHAFTGQYFAPRAAPEGRPAPLFITYYSCPGYVRGGSPGDEWPLAEMAADGIAGLCINYPFGLPLEATDRYDLGLSAVRSGIDLLARRGLVDRTRVGMGGLSFGSEVTLWVAMKSDLLAAASVASPFGSPTYYWFMALRGEDELALLKKAWGLGAPSETPERWKQLSPSYNIDKIHAPLLLQLPEQEYLNAIDYFVPLLRSPTPVEMFAFPHEGHQKVSPRHKLAVYERNLDWFRFWLQDYVDPDPRKAAQYDRWRAERQKAQAAAPRAVSGLHAPIR
jgi:dipeptidyl aminopeptidase/acylaminoacyl peptidase